VALWFFRGLRRGVVTTRYPRGNVDAWTRDLPTPPAFHSAQLTRALADSLVEACPARALAVEGRELIVDVGRCTGCGRCAELGGDAVAPSGEFQLATADRATLIKRVAIAGGEGGDGRG
jgi:ferredoxin-like protein FixX